MEKEKSNPPMKSKNHKAGYNIFDDKNIESLMRYYKIDSPQVLFDYIKKHRLTIDIDDKPFEKKSG
ncbi:MAG TPA: hypothetical protein VLD64_01710 [Nitrosarchaeum sp.]|nr:hypothetical protein [Nitrosarchaeum sp.]